MKSRIYSRYFQNGLLLLHGFALCTSCNLLEPAAKPKQPLYFPFTADDAQWQGFVPQSRWVFENQRHERRTYSLTVATDVKLPYAVTTLSGGYSTRYYYDRYAVNILRTDTTSSIGYLEVSRIPQSQNSSLSELSVVMYWADFIGYDNTTDGINIGYLSPTGSIAGQAGSAVTIRGMHYQHVITARASPLAIQRRLQTYTFAPQRTVQVDYDQAQGVVRFETLNGDVWERVQ